MKSFEDLSDQEIAALTTEERDYYVDLACAEAGAPLLPPRAPVPPQKQAIERDVTVYEAGGFCFTDLNDAQRVCDAINASPVRGTLDYIPGGGYELKKFVPNPTKTENVETVKCLSIASSEKYRADIAAAEQASRQYDNDKKRWDETIAKRNTASSWVRDRIGEACDRESERRRILDIHARYLRLANDDAVVAARFLERAESDAKKLCPELFEFPAVEAMPEPSVAP